jgi:hypothetical protein
MSNFKQKIDSFYDEAINSYSNFQNEVRKSKEKNIKKYGKVKDETILLEDIFNEAVSDMEEYSHQLYATKKRKKPINEDAQEDLFGNGDVKEYSADSEQKEVDQASNPDDMDEMDKADEILETIDLSVIDNSTKLELIRSIIDSAQNYSIDNTDSEDEEENSNMNFDEFIEEVKNVVEEFQYEEQPEEDEFEGEGTEEDLDFEDEEEGEVESTEEEPEDDEFNFEDEDEGEEEPKEDEEE